MSLDLPLFILLSFFSNFVRVLYAWLVLYLFGFLLLLVLFLFDFVLNFDLYLFCFVKATSKLNKLILHFSLDLFRRLEELLLDICSCHCGYGFNFLLELVDGDLLVTLLVLEDCVLQPLFHIF